MLGISCSITATSQDVPFSMELLGNLYNFPGAFVMETAPNPIKVVCSHGVEVSKCTTHVYT
jgi:hypothetical protein